MRRVLVGMAIAVLVSGCGGSHGPRADLGLYTIQDLGVITGDETQTKVSNDGDVLVVSVPYPPPPSDAPASLSRADGPGSHPAARLFGAGEAFVWRAGARTILDQDVSYGDMNDQGQVVATSGPDRSFLWDDGVATDLGSLGGSTTSVRGMNNRGQAVGEWWTGQAYHSFLWENGTMTDLGPELTWVLDINDAGQVLTGNSIWKDGTTTNLGSLGNSDTSAHAINNRGQVVGESWTTDHPIHAFLWQHGHMRDLGALGGEYSCALGINELGQVVGRSRIGAGYLYHAFLWNGRMVDLNTLVAPDSGWVLTSAQDINELGQIVGVGELQGEQHVFLLTP